MNRVAAMCMFIVLALGRPVDAGMLSWLSKWHIEVNTQMYPSVYQAANPMEIRIPIGSGSGGYTIVNPHLHSIDGIKVPALEVTGRIPFYDSRLYQLGLQGGTGITLQGFNAWSNGYANTIGLYVKKPYKFFTGSAWVGSTKYTVSASNQGEYHGSAYAANVGVGLQKTISDNWMLHVALNTTTATTAKTLTYVGMQLPVGYTSPPIYFSSNTTLRIGLGTDFTFIPSSLSLQRQSQTSLENAQFSSIPQEYVAFTRSYAANLLKIAGVSILPSGFSWLETDKRLVVRVATTGCCSLDKDSTSVGMSNLVINPSFLSDILDGISTTVTQQRQTVSTPLTIEILAQPNVPVNHTVDKLDATAGNQQQDTQSGLNQDSYLVRMFFSIERMPEVRIRTISTSAEILKQ